MLHMRERGVRLSLAYLDSFATGWQQGAWTCTTLPRDMNARLFVVPGGEAILGASLRSDRVIGINDLLLDTELYMPVLLHEAGHLMTEPGRTQAPGCTSSWREAGAETLAWCGAGRFSLSREQGVSVDHGDQSLAEVADQNGVPVELVAVGQAILHQLHQPSLAHAERLVLGRALMRWQMRFQQVLGGIVMASALALV